MNNTLTLEGHDAVKIISIDERRLTIVQNCQYQLRLNLIDVVLNLAAENRTTPSNELKQLCYSTLQWIQICCPYRSEINSNWSYPHELKALKESYGYQNYDFLETRFDISNLESIEDLLKKLTFLQKTNITMEPHEIDLLYTIEIYKDHFQEWCDRGKTATPSFWFSNKININSQIPNVLDTDAKEAKRRDNQIIALCNAAIELGFEPLSIPKGGKKEIRIICMKDTSLFTDSAFDHAWKAANKNNSIKMQDKEKYLYNQ